MIWTKTWTKMLKGKEQKNFWKRGHIRWQLEFSRLSILHYRQSNSGFNLCNVIFFVKHIFNLAGEGCGVLKQTNQKSGAFYSFAFYPKPKQFYCFYSAQVQRTKTCTTNFPNLVACHQKNCHWYKTKFHNYLQSTYETSIQTLLC